MNFFHCLVAHKKKKKTKWKENKFQKITRTLGLTWVLIYLWDITKGGIKISRIFARISNGTYM